MTQLGVVVVSRRRHQGPPPSWTHLTAELGPEDELVWVDVGPTANGPWTGTRHLHDRAASRGRAYATGVRLLTTAVVALTDEDTLVNPGWRAATLGGVGVDRPAAGGPVELTFHASRRSVAGRLVDYAPHAIPPYLSQTGDVAGNNVAYLRQVLGAAPQQLWKSEIDARLAAGGHPVALVPAMRVRSVRDYSWSDLLRGRLASGRVYGTQRWHGQPGLRRSLAVVRCLGVPMVRVSRLARTCQQDPALRVAFRKTLPEITLAEVAWGLGEALGCLLGKGETARAW